MNLLVFVFIFLGALSNYASGDSCHERARDCNKKLLRIQMNGNAKDACENFQKDTQCANLSCLNEDSRLKDIKDHIEKGIHLCSIRRETYDEFTRCLVTHEERFNECKDLVSSDGDSNPGDFEKMKYKLTCCFKDKVRQFCNTDPEVEEIVEFYELGLPMTECSRAAEMFRNHWMTLFVIILLVVFKGEGLYV